MKWEQLKPAQMRCLNLLLHREAFYMSRMLLCFSFIDSRVGLKMRSRFFKGEIDNIDDGKLINIYETAKYNFFKFNRLLNRFERKYELTNMRDMPWYASTFKIRKFMRQRIGWESRQIDYKSGNSFYYHRGIYEHWWPD